MPKLSKDFYEKYDTITLAKKLLGCELVHESEEGTTSGMIVETEAYLEIDAASHAFRGKTARNEAMFGQAGTAYIYLIYGIYECFNVVSNEFGKGEAVLIRALQPVFGIELMEFRRKIQDTRSKKKDQNLKTYDPRLKTKNLCNGPGKLVQAMGISRMQNGVFLDGKLFIKPSQDVAGGEPHYQIVTTKRIGIKKDADLPLRFYLEGNEFVSNTRSSDPKV